MNRAPWLIAGGVAALGAAWALSRASGSGVSVNELQTAIATDTRLPWRVRKWALPLAQAAEWTTPTGVDPVRWAKVLAGKLDRESLGGDALKPAGASGTGDFGPRRLSRVEAALLKQGRPDFVNGLRLADVKDDNPSDPLVVLADGTGWGRGLSQIDWMSHDFARTGDWRNPAANLLYGAQYLRDLYRSFASWSGRGTVDPMRLALDAYNAGPDAVRSAVLAGRDPDSVTTGDDYGRNVLERAGLA